MELSFLYHGFGIDRSYHYHATEYKDNSIILKLKSIPIKKVTCPHCGCTEVIRYGVIHRMIHNASYRQQEDVPLSYSPEIPV